MGSLYQEAALDCYPVVSDQGKCIQFSHNNFSLLWPFDTKLDVWQLWIAT
jgi:hypothetical protein